jgi:hypothetical protein
MTELLQAWETAQGLIDRFPWPSERPLVCVYHWETRWFAALEHHGEHLVIRDRGYRRPERAMRDLCRVVVQAALTAARLPSVHATRASDEPLASLLAQLGIDLPLVRL